MARKHTLTKAEVRASDGFAQLGDSIVIWVEEHLALTAGLLGAAILVVLGWIGYQQFSQWNLRRSFAGVDRAIDAYHKPVGAEGGGTASLEELAQEQAGGAEAKRFSDEKARAEAVIGKLGGSTGVEAEGPALVGGFYRGYALMDKGDLDPARGVFGQVSAARPGWEPVQRLARFNEAQALSDAGNYQEAAKLFLDVGEGSSDGLLRSRSYYRAGLNYQLAGKIKDARLAYEQLQELDAEYAGKVGVPVILVELNQMPVAAEPAAPPAAATPAGKK